MLNESVHFLEDSPVRRKVTLRGDSLLISTSNLLHATKVDDCNRVIEKIDACLAKIDSFRGPLVYKSRSLQLTQSVEDVLKLINKVAVTNQQRYVNLRMSNHLDVS